MPEQPAMDRLTGQLAHLPTIIARLGLSVANSQRLMNVDYLESLNKLLNILRTTFAAAETEEIKQLRKNVAEAEKANKASDTPITQAALAEAISLLDAGLAKVTAGEESIASLLRSLAPSRYRFTETTLEFSADLAESIDVSGSATAGIGFGAITVNAGVSGGFARDYKAAARITTVLHAVDPDPTLIETMLARKKELDDKQVKLPALAKVDTEYINQVSSLMNGLTGSKLETGAAGDGK